MPSPDPEVVGVLELDRPVTAIAGSRTHRQARLLTRLHGVVLDEIAVPLGPGGVPASDVARLAWDRVGSRAARHLESDRLPVPATLPADGLPGPGTCSSADEAGLTHVTVVVATRDRTTSLLRCLDSLAALRHPSFDVVVVDSAPSDSRTAEALADTSGWPFVLTHVVVRSPGLGRAHNAALPYVTGEVVAFTDDDVQVDDRWLDAIAAPFADRAVACVTGLILPAELETPAQVWVEQAGGFGRGYERHRFGATRPRQDPLFPLTAGRFGSGANMAFRTEWLRKQPFDDATGAGTPAKGGDDLLAFLRVIRSGSDLVYEPSAVVRHWHRRDVEGLRRQSFGYGVGLGAYLTAAVCADPALLLLLLLRSVPAAHHLLAPSSPKNAQRQPGFPTELVWRERLGVCLGPWSYARSRWWSHRVRARAAEGTGS